MGCPRETVVELLIPVFLPFNLIKGDLNAVITMILYKPVVTALRHAHFIETNQIKAQTLPQIIHPLPQIKDGQHPEEGAGKVDDCKE